VTCLAPVPIFWERASGSNVWDVDGNRFVDLTAAFGVAVAGHAHPRVIEALRDQAGVLLHGMGDVHPSAVRVELLEALARRFPGGGAVRSVVGSSGADAVETALKTAILATGRAGVLAFRGAYHGLSLGVLDLSWRRDFRDPFQARLPGGTVFAPYGEVAKLGSVEEQGARAPMPIGCVLVEPVQGRGGVRVPEPGFLAGLRELCDRRGWLLVVDEIYTGFGRTGAWFACDHEDVVPDILCVGKGLSSGMPISACVGRAEVMDAWPVSEGEALHTQTFLGHPAGCAAALASLRVLEDEKLVEKAAETGAFARDLLAQLIGHLPSVREVRGVGLMLGVELTSGEQCVNACARTLARGVIALPCGEDGRVLSLTPPLSISRELLERALRITAECLSGC